MIYRRTICEKVNRGAVSEIFKYRRHTAIYSKQVQLYSRTNTDIPPCYNNNTNDNTKYCPIKRNDISGNNIRFFCCRSYGIQVSIPSKSSTSPDRLTLDSIRNSIQSGTHLWNQFYVSQCNSRSNKVGTIANTFVGVYRKRVVDATSLAQTRRHHIESFVSSPCGHWYLGYRFDHW